MERWETIKDHPNYEVSNTGMVRNKTTNKILTPHLNNGHERVRVGGRLCYVGRLVSEAFSGRDECEDRGVITRVIRCKDCIHRYEYDHCEDKDDYFYCKYGE